jgi:hypothetical protein
VGTNCVVMADGQHEMMLAGTGMGMQLFCHWAANARSCLQDECYFQIDWIGFSTKRSNFTDPPVADRPML